MPASFVHGCNNIVPWMTGNGTLVASSSRYEYATNDNPSGSRGNMGPVIGHTAITRPTDSARAALGHPWSTTHIVVATTETSAGAAATAGAAAAS
jgi:hypothetical protein